MWSCERRLKKPKGPCLFQSFLTLKPAFKLKSSNFVTFPNKTSGTFLVLIFLGWVTWRVYGNLVLKECMLNRNVCFSANLQSHFFFSVIIWICFKNAEIWFLQTNGSYAANFLFSRRSSHDFKTNNFQGKHLGIKILKSVHKQQTYHCFS